MLSQDDIRQAIERLCIKPRPEKIVIDGSLVRIENNLAYAKFCINPNDLLLPIDDFSERLLTPVYAAFKYADKMEKKRLHSERARNIA